MRGMLTHGKAGAGILALAALLCASPVLADGQQTKENANTFLGIQMVQGDFYFTLYTNRGYYTGEDAKVEMVSGSGCRTNISGRDRHGTPKARYIDWTRVASVIRTDKGFEIVGGVTGLNDAPVNSPEFESRVDYEMMGRVISALEFLHKSCNSSGNLGF